MGFTIREVAEKTKLTAHTLRYYEKEGMLPAIKRDSAGNRDFSDRDMELISVICCLKNTGMPIKQIKEYINWCVVGDETLDMRKELFIKHRQDVLRQIEELNTNLEKIDYKIKYYGNKSKLLCFGEEKEEEQK